MTAEKRRKTCGTHIINGSRKMHLIAVSPDGKFFTTEHYKCEEYVLNLSFFENQLQTNITEDNREENEDHEEEVEDTVCGEAHRKKYLNNVIDSGTFVAMRCPANSLEQFFVGEVLMKEISVENKTDCNGHFILKGEKYNTNNRKEV